MKIAVLLSGGVDSAVALALLQEQGYEVHAFYLKIWLEDELSFLGSCPWEEDLAAVQAVCEHLKVPYTVLSLQKAYWDNVVSYTIEQARAGFTPNPDMLCNQRVKFGAFLGMIDDSFERVATGHYAWQSEVEGVTRIGLGPDPIKDQTYFLAHLSQKQVDRALFPLGVYTKHEVRDLAQRFNLPNKDRKDSQGVCFLGKIKFKEFLRYHLGTKPGPLVEYETGAEVGTHEGFWFYTLGQRQGLGLSGGPWYVVSKDPARNYVSISRDYHAPEKERRIFEVAQCNWLLPAPQEPEKWQVKVRHGPVVHEALIEPLVDGCFRVTLAVDDQGIAPGQFAVFYKDRYCGGCGVIQCAKVPTV